MRPSPILPACAAFAFLGVFAMPATAGQYPDSTVTGPEATRLLNDLGLPAGSCTDKRRFDMVGTTTLRAGYSGTVGAFLTPSGPRLRIDSAISRILDAEQFAGAIGTTKNGVFTWHLMGSARSGVDGDTYWLYPRPGGKLLSLSADPNTLVKVEVNRQGSTAQSASAFYGVRGCLVDLA